MRFFDFDGPVYRVGTEIADVLILSVMWFIFSLPMVTIGASTTALFYIYGKKARGEDIYVIKDFWKSYKQNLIQGIPITIILGILWFSVSAYRFVMQTYQGDGSPLLLSAVSLFFMIEVILMTVYVPAVLSRFHMKVANVFLTAFVLAHKHLLTTVLITIGIILLQYTSIVMPFLLFMTPVLVAALTAVPIQRIFTQHIKASEEASKKHPVDEDNDDGQVDEEDQDEEQAEDQKEEDDDYLKYI